MQQLYTYCSKRNISMCRLFHAAGTIYNVKMIYNVVMLNVKRKIENNFIRKNYTHALRDSSLETI